MKYNYAKDIDFKIVRIKDITLEQLSKFDCGEEVFNRYLKEKAKTYKDATTYIILDRSDNSVLAYFSLSATGVQTNYGKHTHFNMPAIEISMFAIDKKLKRLYYDEEIEKEGYPYYFSDLVLFKALQIIEKISKYVGARVIILYSVPKAIEFYTRNDFIPFDNYMVPSEKFFLKGCIPVYISI